MIKKSPIGIFRKLKDHAFLNTGNVPNTRFPDAPVTAGKLPLLRHKTHG
jgi:hypothetical protein